MTATLVEKVDAGTKKEGAVCPPVGSTVSVHVLIREGDKERVQVFKGTVIGTRGGGTSSSFTVRRISHGIGVERVFPVHSPHVVKVEVEKKGHVRRAKLYYLRKRMGKQARLREKTQR